MNHHTSIKVSQHVGTSPNYRSSADVLFKAVDRGISTAVLDFSEVEFISRGFADQLHKARLEFQDHCETLVVIENANADVQRMMQIVAATQKETSRIVFDAPVIRVQNIAEIERILLSF